MNYQNSQPERGNQMSSTSTNTNTNALAKEKLEQLLNEGWKRVFFASENTTVVTKEGKHLSVDAKGNVKPLTMLQEERS